MSEKILWSSVKIQVPSEFITVTKTGQIRIKPPLTKKNRISTANKEPAIQLIPADVNEVSIIDQGTKESNDTKIYQTKQKVKRELKVKTLTDDYKIRTKENKDMGNEDINRAKEYKIRTKENENMGNEDINRAGRKFVKGSRFVKGSEEAKLWAEKMRGMRKKKTLKE